MIKNRYFILACCILIFIISVFTYKMFYQTNTTEKIKAINFTPKVSGKIIELNIEENSKVKKGEIIAKIDCSEYKIALKKAKENLEKAQNELNNSENKINKIKIETLNEKNDINDAKIQLETANSDYIIYKNAYLDGSVTKKDLDNAIKNLEIAKLEYEKAQNNLNTSKKEMNLILAKKSSQDIKLKQLISEVNQSRLNLSYTTLFSPINGNIKDLKIKVGDIVKIDENILKIIPISK